MLPDRKIVVLTPVKNEAWILPLFLKSTSIWADYIILADQNSTDRSRDIALEYPKVVLINNDSADLDEGYRDRILIEKARELVGHNGILFRIDADEIFSPNFDSEDWDRIKQAKAGSVFMFQWLLMNENLESYKEIDGQIVYGAFVDDGREYHPHGLIHARDSFHSDDTFILKDISLFHFQFADWRRMQSKHIWYQCYERVKFPQKSAIDIYRIYHWMYNSSIPDRRIQANWINDYRNNYSIDICSYVKEGRYWWDEKTKEFFSDYSPQFFRHIETYYSLAELFFSEGKCLSDKLLMLYLHLSRNVYNSKKGILYRLIQKVDNLLKGIFHI